MGAPVERYNRPNGIIIGQIRNPFFIPRIHRIEIHYMLDLVTISGEQRFD